MSKKTRRFELVNGGDMSEESASKIVDAMNMYGPPRLASGPKDMPPDISDLEETEQLVNTISYCYCSQSGDAPGPAEATPVDSGGLLLNKRSVKLLAIELLRLRPRKLSLWGRFKKLFVG